MSDSIFTWSKHALYRKGYLTTIRSGSAKPTRHERAARSSNKAKRMGIGDAKRTYRVGLTDIRDQQVVLPSDARVPGDGEVISPGWMHSHYLFAVCC